ncbi:plancitoxin-1-like [Haemaphysalis longicornis]
MKTRVKFTPLFFFVCCVRTGTLVCARKGDWEENHERHDDVSCKNANGEDVDWFIAYKPPKTKHGDENFIATEGDELAYVDSVSGAAKYWTFLDEPVDSSGNPVSRTLAPIYGPRKDERIAYAVYNDQPPHRSPGTKKGHSKGILMVTQNGGVVWLQHSVPRFPSDLDDGYEYPSSGRKNGQMFFCISFPRNASETIAHHLRVQAANVYQVHKPKWMDLKQLYGTQLGLLLLGKAIRSAPRVIINRLKSRANKDVLAIAKSPFWQHDIYKHKASKLVYDDIAVQSWQSGAGGAQDKDCRGDYDVTNVDELRLQFGDGRVIAFGARQDHSKWHVALRRGLFCFSTLNRMRSQFKRGGEITCLWDEAVAQLFRNSIGSRSECSLNE